MEVASNDSTTQIENEQVAQQSSPVIKRPEISPVKCNNTNPEQVVQQSSPVIKRAETSPVKCNNSNPPVVVFAHGSGAPSTSEWMIRWRNLLANALNAVEVVTFDYPFINGRRKASPKPETLVGFHSDIVKEVAAKYPDHPLILVGKSLGSKVSCMVASENDIDVSAIVCLGYPLKSLKRVIWDGPLLQLTVPIMFVQGSKDILCPLKALEVVRKKLKAVNTLHVIENGDHSFQIARKNLESSGLTREKVEEYAAEAVADFVSQVTSGKVTSGPRNTACLPLQACSNGIQPQHDSRMEVCVEDDDADDDEDDNDVDAAAAGEQNNQPLESKPKVEKFIKANPPRRNGRKRKSERILKTKLKYAVYDKDGGGSTIDKPLNID